MAEQESNNPLDSTIRMEISKPLFSINNYQVKHKLGQGGMGSVYLAFDERLKRNVALKVLAPEFGSDSDMRNRFVQEAWKQARLNHPNIATIHDIGEANGQQYIAMEFVEGQTVRQMLDNHELGPDAIPTIFLQVCAGLQAAHERQLVHRDIKPANVMVTREGQVKLLDFGLAKLQSAAGETQPGMLLGTVSYMSPEQAQAKEVDARSDIFSLGILLYEMVTNQVPFRGDNAISVLFSLVHQPHPDIGLVCPGAPAHFARVIDRALQKNPAQRYQSARELADDFRGTIQSERLSPNIQSAGKTSVAVLQFENQGDAKHDYFADGIADEMNGYLSRLPHLKVIAYSSSRQFRLKDTTLKQIAKELDTQYLLLGALRWDENRSTPFVRISVRLIDAADESVRWAETYDREVDQIFAVQSDVSEQVARSLGLVLGETELTMLSNQHTVNIEAYDFFLRGNEIFPHSVAEEDLNQAIGLYQRAVEIDPQFALAHARLSRVHISMYWFHYDHTPARLALAKREVDRALSIAPELPEALQALGYYYYYGQSNYQKALEQFAAVGTHRPNDASVLASKGYIQRRLGKWDSALQSIENATELDPRSALITYERANTLLLLRRYDEAIVYFDRCLWLTPAWSDVYVKKAMAVLLRDWNSDEAVAVIRASADHINPTELAVEWILLDSIVQYFSNDLPSALQNLWVDEGEMEIYFIVKARLSARLGWANEGRSYYDSARVILEAKARVQPDDPRLHIHLAIAYAGLGRREESLKAGQRALELTPFEKDHILSVYFMELLSLVYAMLGEKEEALKLLRFLLAVPSNFSIPLLRNFSGFDSLRDYRPFQDLIAKASLEDTASAPQEAG